MLTEDQVKQSFLKRFNPWGDTRRQQQDAWNKLKFDMTKDDVDSFVVDMKTLASILGHNDEIIMEKFKDVFPDPNIEAALIAMDDFALMQKKAKQLVHIYKPAHDSPMASAAILVHTAENAAVKSKSSKPKSNQHQLAPISQPQTSDNNSTGDNDYNGGQRGRGRGNYRGPHGHGNNSNSNNRYDNQERGPGRGQGQRDSNYSRGRGHDNSYKGRGRQWDENDSNNWDRDNRDRNYDSQGNSNRDRRWDNNSRGQGHSDRGRGRQWNPHPNSKTLITIDHPRWDINTDTQSHMVSINTSPSNHSTRHKCQPPLNKPLIFVNCATVKAITITNANLQAILWHAHKKPLIKADHTVTKTLIMGNGHKVTVTTMTQMGTLFSSGGSRCR